MRLRWFFAFLFLHKESAHQWIIFQSRRERAINRGHFGREKEEKKKTQQSAGREEMKSSCRTNARHFVQGRRKKPVRDGFRVDSGGSRILARTFLKKRSVAESTRVSYCVRDTQETIEEKRRRGL